MARSHGRLLASIWNDDDWKKHERGPQWTYEMLVSQADLGHSGVIGLRLTRWTGLANGLTADAIRDDLRALEEHGRFVVVDWNTEEVLVRSLIRRDGIWKSPNLMEAVAKEFATIMSPVLRAVIQSELRRLDPAEITDREFRGRNADRERVTAEETRRRIEGLIAVMLGESTPADEAVEEPLWGTPEPTPNGRVRGRVSGRVSEGVQGTLSGGVPATVLARGRAQPHPLSPSPTPSPVHGRAGARGTTIPDDFTLTDASKAYAEKRGMTPDVGRRELDQFRNWHAAKATTYVDWQAAWRTWVGKWAARQAEVAERVPADRYGIQDV